jgi:hypothetical protein
MLELALRDMPARRPRPRIGGRQSVGVKVGRFSLRAGVVGRCHCNGALAALHGETSANPLTWNKCAGTVR